jgi:ABC-2 type transport system permease protein
MKHIFSKQNRALLSELVRTDFKLRYQGSVLGYLWSLLKPLLMFAILYIVFVRFLRIGADIKHYPIYLLLGIVLWGFFTEMTSMSVGSIVGRGDLIRKIRIPRWIIIVSTSISALINLGLNLIIIAVFMIINGVNISWGIAVFPLILIQIYLFALGMSLFLSAAFVKYRDISYIWEVVLQAGFYITPILYPLTLIANPLYQKILLINPLAQAIQDARYLIVTKETITIHKLFNNELFTLIPYALIIIILIAGIFYFRSQAKYFAENI